MYFVYWKGIINLIKTVWIYWWIYSEMQWISARNRTNALQYKTTSEWSEVKWMDRHKADYRQWAELWVSMDYIASSTTLNVWPGIASCRGSTLLLSSTTSFPLIVVLQANCDLFVVLLIYTWFIGIIHNYSHCGIARVYRKDIK